MEPVGQERVVADLLPGRRPGLEELDRRLDRYVARTPPDLGGQVDQPHVPLSIEFLVQSME
jgi:hypothetical protein